MNCHVCKKEFNEHTGRRPKKFCSDACKIKFWNDVKKYELKVKVNNLPENKKKIENERKTVSDHSKHDKSLPESKSQIEIYEDELKTLGSGILANQRKKYVQNQIYKLKQQLK